MPRPLAQYLIDPHWPLGNLEGETCGAGQLEELSKRFQNACVWAHFPFLNPNLTGRMRMGLVLGL